MNKICNNGVYDAQGDYPKSLEYYGKCLKIRLEKLGEEHPAVATTYNNMASVYYHQGDYPQALEYYGKCLKIRLEKLGEEHPDTKRTQESIEIVKSKLNSV